MGTSIRQRERSERAASPPARVRLPAEGVSPLDFLAAGGEVRPRGYWRRGGEWSAWWGSAWRIEVARGSGEQRFAAVREAAARLGGAETDPARADAPRAEPTPAAEGGAPAPRLLGGFAFHPGHRPEAEWAGFPSARFDLPAFELRGGAEGEAVLLAAIPTGDGGRDRAEREARRLLERLRGGRPGRGTAAGRNGRLPAVLGVDHPVSREDWCRGVEAALRAIRAGTVRKVVLARPADVRLAAAPDPLLVLARLAERDEGGFPFLFEPEPGAVFLGISPELVAVREDGRFHASAVAGTAPRSDDPSEDERLGRELLESAKDRTEHAIGVQDMRERLAALGEAPDVDESPHLLRLRGIQHLRTDLSVRVGGDRHVLELLAGMHPTAAVSGYPRGPAAAFLGETETFERGWYAGPVGWFDPSGDGAFAPALRCAVLRGDRARLFAGAGIVEGSDPGREWDETAMKLGPVLEALGGAPEA